MKFVSFGDYPRVIDPVCRVIETTSVTKEGAATDAPSSGHRYTFLYRVPTPHVLKAIPELPRTTISFFGDNEHGCLDACTMLLAYDTGGLLTHMLLRQNERLWVVHEIPEEATGKLVEQPSCRVVFDGHEACTAFTAWLQAKRDGDDTFDELFPSVLDHITVVRTTGVWRCQT